MNINDNLNKNSYTYDLKINTLFFNDMNEFSFGEYKVEDISSLITTSNEETPLDQSWFNFIVFGKKQAIVNSKISAHHSYHFITSNKTIWNANCILKTKQSKEHLTSIIISEISSSLYVCNYSRQNGERWYLFIKETIGQDLIVTLSNNKDKIAYSAHANSGSYVKEDGSVTAAAYEYPFGYTWSDGENDVAAIAMYEFKPKIWLGKQNETSVNSILSMASVGLLLYEFKKDGNMNSYDQM
jgi:hypothetical protein